MDAGLGGKRLTIVMQLDFESGRSSWILRFAQNDIMGWFVEIVL
jgi:hypothetical protein